MTINLSSYGSVESGLFVKIVCSKYKATFATPSFSTQTFLFSDMSREVTIAGDLYTPLGKLLSITTSSSELKISGQEVSVTVSGLPDSSLEDVQASRFKGSTIEIRRAFFNPATGAFYSITDNPMLRFKGNITNLSLNEEYSVEERTSSNSITLICASVVDIMSQKVAGRKTNPDSQKFFYPTDISMDRVPSLIGTFFDFGKTK
jgi:hypothetical protein